MAITSDERACLDRIALLWAQLKSLGENQSKTARYENLVTQIRAEVDAMNRLSTRAKQDTP